MDENKPKNIFEAAGKAKKIERPTPHLPKKEPPPSQSSDVHVQSSQLLNLHYDPEINEMLNKMYRMQEDIQGRLNEAYEQSGVSSSQIKNYLNNPSNFPPETWQKIENQRETLERKLSEVLKIYAKKPKTGHLTKIGSQDSKERKSKTLGARKNWIPMQ